MTDRIRLSVSLLFCRIGVALVFLAWAYDKLKIGFGLPGTGVSDRVMREYYYLDLPLTVFGLIGVAHIVIVTLLITGLARRPVRGYILALSVIPFLLPEYWHGLYDAIFVIAHPTILFFSATALCACAYMIYALRDYDHLLSFRPNIEPDFTDPAFRKTLGRALFFCRLAVFVIFMVWVYSKIAWPEKGVERMQKFWLMPGFPAWGVTAFAWAELVICIVFLFGFFKRWTTAFFVFLGLMAVFTPRVMRGMSKVFWDDSWHTILLYPGTCLLICTIVLYLLRDYDTTFSVRRNSI